MRLFPAHVVSAIKSRRSDGQFALVQSGAPRPPRLLQLTLASMLPGGSPASGAELREHRRERREDLNARYETAAVDSGLVPTVADQVRGDEREMKAGSRASMRQAGMELARERFQASRDAFRSALSQARAGTPTVAADNLPQESAVPGGAMPGDAEQTDTPIAQRPGQGPAPAAGSQSPAPAAAPSAPTGSISPTLTAAPPIEESTAIPVGSTIGASRGAAGANAASLQVQGSAAASSSAGAPEPQSTSRSDAAPAVGATERFARTAAERAKPAVDAPADSAEPGKNIDRILRVLRGQILRDKSTTIIRMDPPELGYLRLQLDLHKDVLRLRIHAETDAARQMLSDDLDALRKGLEAGGLRLEAVEIRPVARVDVSTTPQPQTPAWQDASAESRRERSWGSRPQTGRAPTEAVDRTDAIEPAGGEQAVFAKDSRVNVVV